MGHSEMLLAVAGKTDDEIRKLTARLAQGDWSFFPKWQAQAFDFGHKLTAKPAALTGNDRDELIAVYGHTRALDIIWYVSWCNYMTRVADTLQLPLERENVFARPKPDDRKTPHSMLDEVGPRPREIGGRD